VVIAEAPDRPPQLALLAAAGPSTARGLDDPGAFADAYAEHHRGVYRAAYRILGDASQAEDVTQDVFMRLWRDPGKFDPRRGELGRYLRVMARSRVLDVWREGKAAGRRIDHLKLVVARQEARIEDRPAAMVEREFDRRAVRDALCGLPDAQREAIVLVYWGGLTHPQIAARTGVPLGTVKGRIRLGLDKLLGELEATG